jgi:hypothetical protein
LSRIELLTLGAKDAPDEQIDLLFEQLDLLSVPLIVGLEMLDLCLFLSDQFLKPNYL